MKGGWDFIFAPNSVLTKGSTLYYHNDPEIQIEIIECLGDISFGQENLQEIVKLWHSSVKHEALEKAFSYAVNLIYERHRIARYQQDARDQFWEHLYRLNYEQAVALLDQSGK